MEDFLIEQLETRLLGSVSEMIEDAVALGRGRLGSLPGANFVADVTERMGKESAAIISEEIGNFIKAGSLRRIVFILKEEVMAEVGNNLGLASVGTVMTRVYNKVEATNDFQNMLTAIKDRIIDAFFVIIEEELVDAIAGPVDDFLARYGNYDGDLLDIPRRDIPLATFWGALTLEANFRAGLSAKLSSQRKDLGIEASAAVT